MFSCPTNCKGGNNPLLTQRELQISTSCTQLKQNHYKLLDMLSPTEKIAKFEYAEPYQENPMFYSLT